MFASYLVFGMMYCSDSSLMFEYTMFWSLFMVGSSLLTTEGVVKQSTRGVTQHAVITRGVALERTAVVFTSLRGRI